jgi:NifU-like protein involved in Fe-S cluster formation
MSKMEKEQDEKSPHPDDYVAESDKRSSAEKYVKYPPQKIKECNNPQNLRRLRDANVFARFAGPCGDSMGFYLRIVNEIVEEATFTTSGCCGRVASGSVLTRLVKGKSVKHSRYVTERDLSDALGGMPREKRHCARLAITTSRMALRKYENGASTSKKDKQGPLEKTGAKRIGIDGD